MKSKVKANVNIALIKYWGKKDEQLKLPFQPSLSFTLDQFYTITNLEYDKEIQADILYIDNQLANKEETKRVSQYLDEIRKRYQIPYYAKINSENFVPKAAGLASSSSAFSALALAATKAYGIELNKRELSTVARLGSGSATRSIYSDFVLWHEGDSHESSYSEPLMRWSEFRIIVCLIEKGEKMIGSTLAMKASVNHPKYNQWIEQAKIDLENMLIALKNRDINQLGKIAQQNAFMMHQLLKEVDINYFNETTHQVLEKVIELQKKIPVYATIDAGPNIKLITIENYVDEVINEFDGLVEMVVCKSGEGVIEVD